MKAQSPATQIRHLKREVKAHNARIADILRELDQRRLIGAMLSNICYNGKESDRIPEDFRRSMKSALEAWDGIKRAKS